MKNNSIVLELDRDGLRANFNRYTQKAFRMLPRLNKPRILDIGCGSGVPTMALARLSDGEVFGIDIDHDALEEFAKKISEGGLSDRVKAVECSLFNIEFPDENFDIVWAEGVIAFIGFEGGLREWRRLIKPNGFLVVHDNRDDIESKRDCISVCGYAMIDMFLVAKDAWWNDYYCLLEKRIQELRRKYSRNSNVLAFLDKEQKEVDEFKNNPKYHSSVFFILQKTGSLD